MTPRMMKHPSTLLPFTSGYQAVMEPPVIAGHIFWRIHTGTVVCYEFRKEQP